MVRTCLNFLCKGVTTYNYSSKVDFVEKSISQETKDEKNNKLQKLSVAHIHVQRLIENDLVDNSVFDSDFIRFVHREMYSQDGMEQYLNIFDKDTGKLK